MDNNKENTLNNELDMQAQEQSSPIPADAQKPQAHDAALEQLLNENWSSGGAASAMPEAAPVKPQPIEQETEAPQDADAFGDNLDFDALLAADALSDDTAQAPVPAETAVPEDAPASVEEPAPAEDAIPAEEAAPAEDTTPTDEPAPAEEAAPAEPIDAEPEIPAEADPLAEEPAQQDDQTESEQFDASEEESDEDYDEDADEIDEEYEDDFDDEPYLRKGRPKRKSGYGLFGIPHIVSTVIWLALILAIGVSLGRTLWVCCADIMAFGKESKVVTITITEDDDIDSIAKKLGDADLVRYPSLFKFFANVTGKSDNIGVGTYTLNAQLDYNAMINAMYSTGPKQETVTIMFPEGYNCAQIFDLLEKNGVCDADALYECAREDEWEDYWFLEGVQDPDPNYDPNSDKPPYCRLEGYLAPDTYSFYKGDSPRRVLEKFLDEFDERFTDIMKEDFEKIREEYAKNMRNSGLNVEPLTLHQLVTLASIIEKETSSDDESFKIATVFYNRLKNPDIRTLGADAALHYAIKDYYWEEELTASVLKTDSPYNTREKAGIPPGPICNMGVQALYAALEPYVAQAGEESFEKMHYFVYDPKKGEHIFAKTLQEHNKNLRELGY